MRAPDNSPRNQLSFQKLTEKDTASSQVEKQQ